MLVPRGRIDEATREVKETFSVEGAGPWRGKSDRRVAIIVVSWTISSDVLIHVDSERFRSEFEQFKGMYWS